MKAIGVFRELGRRIDPSVPSIRSAAGQLPDENAAPISRYLRSGITVFDVMESTVDPFDNSTRIDGGPSLLSDGAWVWRNDLSYFVEKYKIDLPADFVSHALQERCVKAEPAPIIAQWKEIVAAYELAERGLCSR